MSFKIPQSVKMEHQTLHAELAEATKVGGKIGEAAKTVAQLLDPHLEKEEAYVLPLLGLLPHLAAGQLAPQMETILPRPERLKTELPQMLEEHKAIAAALTNFIEAAKQAGKPEYVQFAERLLLHAQMEEEVLYPAAVLIDEYLTLKLRR